MQKVALSDENKKILEDLKQKNHFILEKMKIENNNKIELDKMKNSLSLQLFKSKKAELNNEREIFRLKKMCNMDKKLIRTGYILMLFCLIGLAISALITISGGMEIFNKNDFTKIAFVGAVLVLQTTIFIIGVNETTIKQNFRRHLVPILLLKYCILCVSIFNNYEFFHQETSSKIATIVIIIFCICIDLTCVFIMSLASDCINLMFDYETEKLGFFTKLFLNLSSPFTRLNNYFFEKNKLKDSSDFIENSRKSKSNVSRQKTPENTGNSVKEGYICQKDNQENIDKKIVDFNTEKSKNESSQTKVKTGKSKIGNPSLRTKNFISKNYQPGDKINVGILVRQCKINEPTWKKLRKEFIESEFLKVEGGNTYMV